MIYRNSLCTRVLATLTLLMALILVVGLFAAPVVAGGGGGGVCTGSYVGRGSCRADCLQKDCPNGFYKCNAKTYNVLIDPEELQLVNSTWGPPGGSCYLGESWCPGFCNN